MNERANRLKAAGCSLMLMLGASNWVSADERSDSYAAHNKWKQQLIETLQRERDADSLLAAMLIAGGSREQSRPLIERMVAVGQSNSKVLWAAAMSVACAPASSSEDCDRSLRAAKALARADASNAMAWLTLAFLSDQAKRDSGEIDQALGRATGTARFHDYGFDLVKAAVAATGRQRIPEESLPMLIDRRMSPAEARLDIVGMAALTSMAATPIVQWVLSGCASVAQESRKQERAKVCRATKDLFQRGDSQQTLMENPEALKEIRANVSIVNREKDGVSASAYSKAMVESYAAASSERDFWQRLSKEVRSTHGR